MDRANISERKKSNLEKTELNQQRLKSNKTQAAQIVLGQKSKKKVGKNDIIQRHHNSPSNAC